MMRTVASAIVALAFVFSICAPVPAHSFQYSDNFGAVPKRWIANPIIIAFSSSLNSPPSNIKSGSDVIGAARRALRHWSSIANVHFFETATTTQTISPQNLGDGVNVITVSTENAGAFGSSESPGRTRVYYDPSGVIVEADVALNPNQLFSSDGTPGTYDLESTFTHEIGHLIGLEHSAVIGATMQPRQAKNGLFNLPALTQRTLSEDDCAGARSLYGSRTATGSISGKLMVSGLASDSDLFGAQVFAEDVATGKVIAGNVTSANGAYRIDGLEPGNYRLLAQTLNGPITAADIATTSGSNSRPTTTSPVMGGDNAGESKTAATVNVEANSSVSELAVPLNPAAVLRPRVIGLNGELSTVAIPLSAGETFTVYIGGEGLDQIPADGISIASPFMKVDPASVELRQFGASYPVISFDLTVAPNAQAGDYSVRLQSTNGEPAYLAGALTIDPGVDSSAVTNATDDPKFFVRQHYRDFLGREPDAGGLEYWTSRLSECGNDAACIRAQRIAVSTAFFAENEFQQTGGFIYRVYQAGLARRPAFSEFGEDRGDLNAGGNLESSRQAFALDFVARPEFVRRYPANMTATEFIDRLLASVHQNSAVDLSTQRDSLLALWDGNDAGRAAILRRVTENPEFVQAEYNRAFVLMQYFGYLRRDADPGGYDFWLNVLNNSRQSRPDAYHAMVCAFLTSKEYQLRFGIAPTHTNRECG